MKAVKSIRRIPINGRRAVSDLPRPWRRRRRWGPLLWVAAAAGGLLLVGALVWGALCRPWEDE